MSAVDEIADAVLTAVPGDCGWSKAVLRYFKRPNG